MSDVDDTALKREATALKEQGNDAFKKHDYPAAVDFYTQAIERYAKEPSYYTNRAQVWHST
jgi:serine/threonine-protein phosphatase 5